MIICPSVLYIQSHKATTVKTDIDADALSAERKINIYQLSRLRNIVITGLALNPVSVSRAVNYRRLP